MKQMVNSMLQFSLSYPAAWVKAHKKTLDYLENKSQFCAKLFLYGDSWIPIDFNYFRAM